MKYLLKTKGTDVIPDYLQIRDENFLLIAHCGLNRIEKVLQQHQIKIPTGDPIQFTQNMPYGKLIKINDI